jgi:hypothetical protein
MSYAVQPPVFAPPLAPGPRRPLPASLAALVLQVMAVFGLIYAVVTIVTAPGSVSRFRAAAAGAASADVDGYVSVIWIGAAIGMVLALILVALYFVLSLGLRRGSNAARIATWVVCGLGLLAGLGSTVTVLVQRSGDSNPQSLAAALTGSYPSYWIHLNLTLAIAQTVGYLVVATLLLLAGGAWFGRARATPAAPTYPPPGFGGYAAPAWGPGSAAPGYGPGSNAPGYGPGVTPPGYSPGSITPGYGPAATPPGLITPGYGSAPPGPPPGTASGGPGSITPSYGQPAAGVNYGAPYAPGRPPVSEAAPAPAADQAYQSGAGQEWARPGAPQGQPQYGPAPAAPGQPFGLPPAHPDPQASSTGETSATPPDPGPDDELWSRPSS